MLPLCDGGGEDDADDDEGAGEGDDGAAADDDEDEGGGALGVLDVLEDVDDGGVDDIVLSRWQPAAPTMSAMPSTSESLRFNIVRTSHLV